MKLTLYITLLYFMINYVCNNNKISSKFMKMINIKKKSHFQVICLILFACGFYFINTELFQGFRVGAQVSDDKTIRNPLAGHHFGSGICASQETENDCYATGQRFARAKQDRTSMCVWGGPQASDNAEPECVSLSEWRQSYGEDANLPCRMNFNPIACERQIGCERTGQFAPDGGDFLCREQGWVEPPSARELLVDRLNSACSPDKYNQMSDDALSSFVNKVEDAANQGH